MFPVIYDRDRYKCAQFFHVLLLSLSALLFLFIFTFYYTLKACVVGISRINIRVCLVHLKRKEGIDSGDKMKSKGISLSFLTCLVREQE